MLLKLTDKYHEIIRRNCRSSTDKRCLTTKKRKQTKSMIHKCKLKELFIRFSKWQNLYFFDFGGARTDSAPNGLGSEEFWWNRECFERTNFIYHFGKLHGKVCRTENGVGAWAPWALIQSVDGFAFLFSVYGFPSAKHICRQSRNNSSYSGHFTIIATECVKMSAYATVAMSFGKEHHETNTRKSVFCCAAELQRSLWQRALWLFGHCHTFADRGVRNRRGSLTELSPHMIKSIQVISASWKKFDLSLDRIHGPMQKSCSGTTFRRTANSFVEMHSDPRTRGSVTSTI